MVRTTSTELYALAVAAVAAQIPESNVVLVDGEFWGPKEYGNYSHSKITDMWVAEVISFVDVEVSGENIRIDITEDIAAAALTMAQANVSETNS